MEGWVGLVGWPIAEGAGVEGRAGKVSFIGFGDGQPCLLPPWNVGLHEFWLLLVCKFANFRRQNLATLVLVAHCSKAYTQFWRSLNKQLYQKKTINRINYFYVKNVIQVTLRRKSVEPNRFCCAIFLCFMHYLFIIQIVYNVYNVIRKTEMNTMYTKSKSQY